MDETTWGLSSDVVAMLLSVLPRVTLRQLRLFLAACARRIVVIREKPAALAVVELAERFADNEVSLDEARQAVGQALGALQPTNPVEMAAASAISQCAGAWFTDEDTVFTADPWPQHLHFLIVVLQRGGHVRQSQSKSYTDRDQFAGLPEEIQVEAAERAVQAYLLRDVMGNPFRPPTIDPGWLAWDDGRVTRLAEAAYAERDHATGYLAWDPLRILADALEDAGCADQALLAALRADTRHPRGFWALDAVLGRR
jgi:hypothetical protein